MRSCWIKTASRPYHLAFSLVEVLVAVALFATALTVLSLSVHSVLTAVISFETSISREEDLRFLRAQIPQNLSREELLAGGRMRVPQSGEVTWHATIEPLDIIDCFRIDLTYDFPDDPQPVHEHYYRYITGWMDPVERSVAISKKRELAPDDNRLSDEPPPPLRF